MKNFRISKGGLTLYVKVKKEDSTAYVVNDVSCALRLGR